MRSSLRVVFVFCLCAVFLWSANTYLAGQARTTEIRGSVKDAQGAVVPGADITALNEATGVSNSSVSNDVGLFRFTNLVSGPYTIRVALAGFKTYERTGYNVVGGMISTVYAVLEIGEVTERVTVTGEAPLLITESVEGLSDTLGQRELRLMPNIQRKWDFLINLSALTTRTRLWDWGHDYHTVAGNDTWAPAGFYMNGVNQGLGNEGSTNTQGMTNEFVKEFRFVASNMSAEFAGTFGMLAITHSGSNDFHGAFNVFFQDDAINAAPWGTRRGDVLPFREFDIGGSIGGPIVKDKVHFFFAYQREKVENTRTGFITMASLLQRGGDFSQTFNTAGDLIPVYDPTTGNQFPGNVIPLDRHDPVAVASLAELAAPNRAGTISGAQNFQANRFIGQTQPFIQARADVVWNDNNSTMFMENWNRFNTQQPSIFGTPGIHTGAQDASLGGGAQGIAGWQTMLAVAHTYVPNPQWVSETSFGGAVYRFGGFPALGFGDGWPATIGLKGTNADVFPRYNLEGYDWFGGLGIGGNIHRHGRDTAAQRFTGYVGRHTIKFGTEIAMNYQNCCGGGSGNTIDFSRNVTAARDAGGAPITGTGDSIASMLLGQTESGRVDIGAAWRYTFWYPQFYVEDSIKVADNFTLNLGWRYEALEEPYVRDREPLTFAAIKDPLVFAAEFDRSGINPVSGTPGVITYFDDRYEGGGIGHRGSARPRRQHYPRMGFAWQPGGAGTSTVIRGGAGRFPFWSSQLNLCYGCGNADNRFFSTPDLGVTPAFLLRDGYPLTAGEEVAEAPGPGWGAVKVGEAPRGGPGQVAFYNDRDRGYNWQANFGIQQEVGWNSVIEVYGHTNLARKSNVGIPQNHLTPDLWQAVPEGDPQFLQRLRPFPQYGDISQAGVPSANGSWHAFQVKYDKRYSSGLNFTLDYVWSKWRDGKGYWDVFSRRETGWSMRDRQERFVAYAIYDLPWGVGQRWLNSGPLSAAFGNWTWSTYFRLESGAYLDATHDQDTTNGFRGGQGNQGLDLVGNPNKPSGSRTLGSWFNTEAYAAPAAYTLGNAGRTLVESAGQKFVDWAIMKDFRFHEAVTGRVEIQMRNVFNWPVRNNPVTTWADPSFGRITGKQGNRQIQLGFRVLF